MKILVIHGPALDMLGDREPQVYGTMTLEEIDALIHATAASLGVEVETHQTAREGAVIEMLIEAVGEVDGAVVNPGAYAHTSRAIADAIAAVPYPVIEVHLTNIHAREQWRRTSVTGEAAAAVISGLGPRSYVAAVTALKEMAAG